jgi:hypothetical protein
VKSDYDDDNGGNMQRLIDAGVIPGPIPPPYDRVINDLSEDEVEALISIKEKLDAANQDFGGEGHAGFIGMVAPL